jgi:DNA-binding SARP family transcriptional activator/tetratricopeptide (TPR) repeat protein
VADAFRLRVFGGALIEGSNGPLTGAFAQRRRLALLSLLAASPAGSSRDRIVSLLWPESDDERARHSLAQLVHALRRDFGDHVISGGSTAIRLEADVLPSDIADFDRAIAAGRSDEAAALYTGPFLDGFHLGGCAEFERWVDGERDRTRTRATQAIETLARRAFDANEFTASVSWWRRLAGIDPYDSRFALGLVKALATSGDPAGAMRQARVHETLLRDEFGTDPDPAITAFLATLAEGAGRGVERRASATPHHDSAETSDAVRATMPAGTRVAMPPHRRGGRTVLVAAFVIVAAGIAALAATLVSRVDASDDPSRIVMADVENSTGDAAFDDAIPVALAATLGQSPRAFVLPPERVRETLARMRTQAHASLPADVAREVARREGADVVVVAAIDNADDGYVITVRTLDPPSGAVRARIRERADSRADVIDAIDAAARALRRKLGESRSSIARTSIPLPRVTTSSLDALEKYAAGARAFERNRLDEAEMLWKEAVSIDTAFSTAEAALGQLYYWMNRPTDGDTHFDRALAYLDGLPDRDRAIVRAQADTWRGNRQRAVATLRAYLEQHPQDVAIWSKLGYLYMRMGLEPDAIGALERVLARDTFDYAAWVNLATIQKRQHRYDDAIASYRHAFRLAPSIETTNNNINLEYGTTFVLAGDPASAESVFRKMLAGDRATHARGLRSIAFLDMHRGRYVEAARRLEEAILQNRADRSDVSELRNRLLLATASERLGRSDRAATERDSAFAIGMRIDAEPTLLLWTGTALARNGRVANARTLLAKLRDRLHAGNATERAAEEMLHGEVMVASDSARAAVGHLEVALRTDSTALVLESLAHAAEAAGLIDRAADLYEELSHNVQFGWEAGDPWRLAPFNEGRLREQGGDADGAIRAYQRFIGEWREADPAFPPIVDAKARLARLRETAANR